MLGIGFELTDLGGGSYAINGVPDGIDGLNWGDMIKNIVESYINDGTKIGSNIYNSISATMARRASIPVGQVLTNTEMENIVNELFSCDNVNYTPDGNAILCILPQREIEHLFGENKTFNR